MFVFYNPNPTGRLVDDCSVRAVSKALDIDWESAFAKMTASAFLMGDMPSSNSVWGAVLRMNGFSRKTIEEEQKDCFNCYTAEQFCYDHPVGVYVLGFGDHVATAVDGNLYDTWDSSSRAPQYFWYKKER